ncbi:DUF541 domain-containing protein [Candidatus Fermentibacteria bacterium]|nr:DUF541 domain-containing protein [Candidatus Fermentibacteria bacterium]
MRVLTAAIVLIAGLAYPESAQTDQGAQATPWITVTGNGMASAEPDLAVITAGVNVTMHEPGAAVDSAAVLVNDVMAAARALGVRGEDMQTTYYNLWIEEEYDSQSGRYTGKMVYHAQHTLQFRVREVSEVGDVLAGLVEAGANSVSGVAFTVEDQRALEDEAYADAVANARHKAELLAESMNVSLGRMQSLSEWGYTYPETTESAYYNYGGGLSSTVSVPPVTPGSFRISAQVQVTFEVE